MPTYTLAVYVIAYGELVLLVVVLSFAGLVVRWAVIAGIGVLVAGALAIWALAGRPRGPALRPALRSVAQNLRDPPLAILAVAAAIGFAYLTSLALFTPPNTFDALWYHLSRAAFWKQQHSLGYIPDANDARLNANPPVGEIGLLYTMVVAGTDRFVSLVSLAAYATLPITVYGIARRLHVDGRPALFAALVFTTLPVVVLQASGAKNDLVLASFATACVYFCLGTRTIEIALAGISFALALGTKAYAPLFLPVIALVVAVGTSRRRAIALAITAVPTIVAGSAWNFVNLAHSGSFLGDLTDGSPGSGMDGFVDFVAITARYVIDFAEVPGAGGWWFTCYGAAALALAVLLLRNRHRWKRTAILAAGLIGLIPFLVIAFGPLAKRGYQYVLFHSGRADLGMLDYTRAVYTADQASAYYGPIGVAVLLSVLFVARRRCPLRRVSTSLAAAPLLFLLCLAVTVGYNDWAGRFFEFAVALAVAASAIFFSSRPVVWAVVALSIPTLVLTLRANSEKPPSVWGKTRWEVQTLRGPGNDEWRLIRFAEESIPPRAGIGLAINPEDWSYPFFGQRLERHVRFVSSTQQPPDDIDWLVQSRERRWSDGPPPPPWREVIRTPHDWRLYRTPSAWP